MFFEVVVEARHCKRYIHRERCSAGRMPVLQDASAGELCVEGPLWPRCRDAKEDLEGEEGSKLERGRYVEASSRIEVNGGE